jgi:uncharacterized protein (TIGR03083 family)
MEPVGRIEVLDILDEERALLLELLTSLHRDDWGLPTICDGWSVKDIAAHIIGDDFGRLSRGRDGHRESFIETIDWAELVVRINAANEQWVAAMRRLSPEILTDLLRATGEQTRGFFRTLDLEASGMPVSWAGPDPAPVWFDLAREYTERWAHQQQIRDAVGKPGAKDRRLFAPVLDTYIRATPYTYRDVIAPVGTQVRLRITGEAGGSWTLVRGEAEWALVAGSSTNAEASLTLDQEEAWRLFTRGTTPEAARAWAMLGGDATLAAKALETLSVIA